MELNALAERLEAISIGCAAREGIDRDDDRYLLTLQEELGELTQVQLGRTGCSEPRGFTLEQLDAKPAEECADALGRILLFARRNGVDLTRALGDEWLRWEQETPLP